MDQAIEVIKKVRVANLKLQVDCNHRAMLGKDVVEGLAKSVRHLRHIQITGMPGRNAANSGMVDYTAIFQILIDLNYDGWIGCEYHPLGKKRATGLDGAQFGSPDFTSVLMSGSRGIVTSLECYGVRTLRWAWSKILTLLRSKASNI